MDNTLLRIAENNTAGSNNENFLVPVVDGNARKRKYTEEVADINTPDNVPCNWHSSNKKFSELPLSSCIIKNAGENNDKQVRGLNSTASKSKVEQRSQMLNSKQKSNQSPCQIENDKQAANQTINFKGRNSSQMVEQNVDSNRNRILTYFSNNESLNAEPPIWSSNINQSQRTLLNWHPFHHRLYLRQQLEMERRRVSLLKNSSRNALDFGHIFIGQIGRGIIPSKPDEEVLRLKKFITASTRILSSEEAVNFEEATCVICFMKFKEQPLIRELSCLHKFHKDCIDKWLVNQMNCPICRLPLDEYFSTNNSTSSNSRSFINSQIPSATVINQYQSKEMNNSQDVNDGIESATTESAEIRDFQNNSVIHHEDYINVVRDSVSDINNGCIQNNLNCNQSESQETTDHTSESYNSSNMLNTTLL